MRPLLGTWPATQACALAGNQTGNALVLWPALNPLSHTSQGKLFIVYLKFTLNWVTYFVFCVFYFFFLSFCFLQNLATLPKGEGREPLQT